MGVDKLKDVRTQRFFGLRSCILYDVVDLSLYIVFFKAATCDALRPCALADILSATV